MKREFSMTPEEILRDYQQAKDKGKQIGILADMNCCTKQEIIEILKAQGVDGRTLPRAKRKDNPSGGNAATSPCTGEATEEKAEETTKIQTVRRRVLDRACACVCGDREEDYGTPEANFERIALLWTSYLGKWIEPHDVAAMMILLKVARVASGNAKEDNWIDIAGYAACGAECQFEQEEAKDAVSVD